jgi:hypothetical protein
MRRTATSLEPRTRAAGRTRRSDLRPVREIGCARGKYLPALEHVCTRRPGDRP